jgi:hypothetical protein
MFFFINSEVKLRFIRLKYIDKIYSQNAHLSDQEQIIQHGTLNDSSIYF